jgi:carbon monoxide dehydrogenase subunit G
MADIEHQVTIAKPISEVYTAMTDYENLQSIQRWQPDTLSLGVTAGSPLRAGSMIAMSRRFMGSKTFVNVDVLEIQRNKRIELKGIHGRFPFSREIELSPSGRETIIHDSITLKIGWLFFWYRPFLQKALTRQTAQEWQNLKKLMES